jgi:ATP-dependent Clp protease ATP-binding subunit ClpC
MNGYNFTERVRKVLAMAREEAVRLHHEYVGTEHILLGLIREGEGVAATVLQNLRVDLDELKSFIENVVRRGKGGATGPDLPYTSRAKKVLELAMTEARELNHAYVGTEHLLLGLIRENQGIAAQVLFERGVTADNARAEVLRILGTEMPRTGRFGHPPPNQPPPKDSMFAVVPPHTAERVRDVMRDAEDIATELRAAELLPIHVAISLLRHGEGLANAVLDRFNVDRPALLRALMAEASEIEPVADLQPRLKFGEFMVTYARQVESETRWRHAPPTTLNILLALLDTVKDVALIFEAHGIDAARVRAEARRISG